MQHKILESGQGLCYVLFPPPARQLPSRGTMWAQEASGFLQGKYGGVVERG